MDCLGLLAAYILIGLTLIVMAIVILVVLSCTTRRKNLYQNCCSGRPGLFTPVNLLHRGRHRLIYAVVFGAMSDEFLSSVLLGSNLFGISGNPYGMAFFNVVVSKLLLVLLLCVVYGPVFACVDTPKPLLGHVMGLVYLVFLILTVQLQTGIAYSECSEERMDKALIAINILSNSPSYLFYVILLVWFVYHIANDIVMILKGRSIHLTNSKHNYLFKYTRNLLKKKRALQSGRLNQLKTFFWAYEKDFRFPLKFLAALVVMISIVFKLCFLGVSIAYSTGKLVEVWRKARFEDISEKYDDIILSALTGFSVVGTLSPILSSLLCLVLLVQMVATVHKHLKLAAQGKFKFYSGKPPSHTKILVSSLKYSGYQIGYFVWAWLIFSIVLLVIGLLAEAVILGLKYFPDYVGPPVLNISLSLLWLPAVLLAHKVMCKFVFLEANSKGKFLSITNRNAFNWFSYFVFLYNAIVGFVGAIVRVLLSLLLGTLLLFRLDQNIMMGGFQFADWGNKTYRRFLYVEHSYNNPVANAFVVLLLEGRGEQTAPNRGVQNAYNIEEFGEEKKEKLVIQAQDSNLTKKRRIRNRWLVAYTLLRNPSLRPLTAARLREQESTTEVVTEPGTEIKGIVELLIPGIN